jgi:aspartyl-tRNA(Asn)/glutamyl-tRNA(Gln) amidotransferase subunit C
MLIDENLIDYLEDLSCLSLSREEKRRLTGDLGEILNGMERLCALDTMGISERSHPFDAVNAFREDRVQASFPRELILKNAPVRVETMFLAPKTVEQAE